MRLKLYKNKAILEKLYWGENLSLPGIAERLDCSLRTVYRYFLKYKITRRNISQAVKLTYDNGRKTWNRGLTKEDPRVRHYCFNSGNFKKGQKKPQGAFVFPKGHPQCGGMKKGYCYPPEHEAWNKGLTAETDDRVRQYVEKLKGREISEEWKKRISEAAKKRFSDPRKHPSWLGGKSFEPYPIEFNNALKRQIRTRDDYKCQECGVEEAELDRLLCVHHIDYDKENNDPANLISLCIHCHTKTNFNRAYWTNHLRRKVTKLLCD